MNRSYSKIRHIQESNTKLETRVLTEQIKQTNQNPWSNYPCVAKFKDEVSPKGQKSKRGDGIFANTLFYPNGRAMDNATKTMYFFKCDPLGIIVGQELEGLEIDV